MKRNKSSRGRRYSRMERHFEESVRANEARQLERQRREQREARLNDTDWLAEDERKVDR